MQALATIAGNGFDEEVVVDIGGDFTTRFDDLDDRLHIAMCYLEEEGQSFTVTVTML